MDKRVFETISGVCLFDRFKKSSSKKSSSNTTSTSRRVSAGGNFSNLRFEDSGNNYLLKGSYTVKVPISQLGLLVGVSNEATGNNINSVLLTKFFQARQGSVEQLNMPITKAVGNFKYLVLIVVTDSDNNLSFETVNNYNVTETAFVPIKDIKP